MDPAIEHALASLRPVTARSTCANCDEAFLAFPPKPFCSDRCQQMARAIRYARSSQERYGWPWPEDVLDAFVTKMAWTTVGGYQRNLTDAERRNVVARDDGQCVLCGAEGSEVDHVSGRSSRSENLRLLCHDCHRAKTLATAIPVPFDVVLWSRVLRRAKASPPERPCDSEAWATTWRQWVRDHELA